MKKIIYTEARKTHTRRHAYCFGIKTLHRSKMHFSYQSPWCAEVLQKSSLQPWDQALGHGTPPRRAQGTQWLLPVTKHKA